MGKKALLWIVVFISLVMGGLGYLLVKDGGKNDANKDVASFEDCVDLGYPVRESYPEVCTTPEGRSFTKLPETPSSQSISMEEALKLINNCEAIGTYELHNGDAGLILKNDRYQLVKDSGEEILRQNQNPRCPFTKAAIE